MKKRFSHQQIISIFRESEAGLSAHDSAASTPFPMPRFTHSVRSVAVTQIKRLKSLRKRTPDSSSFSRKPY